MRSRSTPGLVVSLALLAALAGCYRFSALRTASVCSAEGAREAATEDAASSEPRMDYGAQCGSSRRYVNRVYRDTYESLRGSPPAATATATARDERDPEELVPGAESTEDPSEDGGEEPDRD